MILAAILLFGVAAWLVPIFDTLVHIPAEDRYFVAVDNNTTILVFAAQHCPEGLSLSEIPTEKPMRSETRHAFNHFGQISVSSEPLSWIAYHRSNFYECIESEKDTQ